MTVGEISRLRQWYHQRLFETVLRVNDAGKPNNADASSPASVAIGRGIIERIGGTPAREPIAGQTAGQKFEEATRDFLRDAFALLLHLRPGTWEFSLGEKIEVFEQYQHLADINKGRAPHVSVVTAEPLPTRISSLAMGTGDIDCVYHFALPELIDATDGNGPHGEMLATLVSGHRLRDIADLPFDLAV